MKPTTEWKCADVQFWLDDLARNRLAEPVASQLRQHLADCTDCRVAHQRGIRLQRLLALQRHEQPPPAYFENFLGEFHRRLAAAESQPSVWQRLLAPLAAPLPGTWRLGVTGACAIALVAGLSWIGLRNSQEAVHAAHDLAGPSFVVYAKPPPPALELSLEAAAPATETLPGGLTLTTASAFRPTPPAPRYVLDEVPMTPVSYEVRANF
jgi:anti-sigma factor RsiW